MHIIVVGAGIVGLASAWQLRKDGHRVTVVDRAPDVGLAASHANGGQLSYRYVAPLADPDVLAKIPGWMLRGDAPVRFRPQFDAAQWRWILRFLRACNGGDKLRSVAALLPLSLYSRALVHELVAQEGLDFDYVRNGKLVVHRDPASFDSARRLLAAQPELADEQQALDAEACVALEPALAHLRRDIRGGIHTASEEAGDCLKLCRALAARLREGDAPARFELGRAVEALDVVRGTLRGIRLADGTELAADACVLANGVAAPAVLRPHGLALPIYPVKGYSISARIRDETAAPAISVTDFQRKIVYARLGTHLRVAGMADIVGFDEGIDARRIGTLVAETRACFGAGVDLDGLAPWAGLRPATPSGRPLIGASGIDGLWLNLGHGALGFTLAMGSAGLLADRIAGREPAVPDEDLRPAHTAAHGRRVRRTA